MSLALRMMPTTATGRRPTTVHDGHGGWAKDDEASWPIVGTDIPAKYDPSDRGEQQTAEQERQELRGRLFLPLNTDVARGDLWTVVESVLTIDGDPLVIDGEPITISRRLEILAVERPGGRSIGGAGGHLVCRVLELQPDVTAP